MKTQGILENLIRALPLGRARRRYEKMLMGPPLGGVLCKPPRAATDSVENNTPAKDGTQQPKPYIDSSGNLMIPTLGPEKYHWWSGGQGVLETLIELGADEETIKKYLDLTTNAKTQPKTSAKKGFNKMNDAIINPVDGTPRE
jgi:hypothetical protein